MHCRSLKQLQWIKKRIEQRLKLCKLSLNDKKTRVVYCKDSRRSGEWTCQSFDFLGYTFRPRSSRNHRGELFVSFSPAISRKASKSLRQTIRREWKLQARSQHSIEELARRLNPVITGWINYYGRFCRSEMHSVLDRINVSAHLSPSTTLPVQQQISNSTGATSRTHPRFALWRGPQRPL
ncbi:group II intron maturase-specific domain-containing protein [Magnetococcus marinus]|uniref:group II intron maturase-specific domain-containing protein n=1 Tax=Magnetococcus marinus TaxID=1124597 RepID=UPI0002FF5B06|nr:group II intron maturase-specific domain-containing protein [Magnetococcus marinus]